MYIYCVYIYTYVHTYTYVLHTDGGIVMDIVAN